MSILEDALSNCPAAGVAHCSTVSMAELLTIAPVLILLLGYLLRQFRLPQLNQAWTIIVLDEAVAVPMPRESILATRVWSLCLLLCNGLMLWTGAKLSIPLQGIVGLLFISGLLIDKPFCQSIFHVCSTCSWFAMWDAMLYVGPALQPLEVMLSVKGMLFALMVSGSIIRQQHGHQWQYADPSYALVGFLFIISYFWAVELPLCSIQAMSAVCSYLGRISNFYHHSSFYERIFEVMMMAVVHILFNGFLYFNRRRSPDAITERDATMPIAQNSHFSTNNKDLPSADDISRRFSGATDTEDDNQCIMDESGRQRKLPGDCVEISEAEAIEIIQKGLNSFKRKIAK